MAGTNVGAVVGVEQTNRSPSSVVTNIEQCKCFRVVTEKYCSGQSQVICPCQSVSARALNKRWLPCSFKNGVFPPWSAFMFTVFGCSVTSHHAVRSTMAKASQQGSGQKVRGDGTNKRLRATCYRKSRALLLCFQKPQLLVVEQQRLATRCGYVDLHGRERGKTMLITI